VEAAIALNLAFQPVEEIAFELQNLPASQAGHMNVVPLRAALVEMFFALHVHQVKFVHQTVPFEQFQSAIHRDAINSGIQFSGMAENLRGIEVLTRGFNNA
jgi:hypothetical protein